MRVTQDPRGAFTFAQLGHPIDRATAPGGWFERGGLVVPSWDGWRREGKDAEIRRGSNEAPSLLYSRLSARYDEVFQGRSRRKRRRPRRDEDAAVTAVLTD